MSTNQNTQITPEEAIQKLDAVVAQAQGSRHDHAILSFCSQVIRHALGEWRRLMAEDVVRKQEEVAKLQAAALVKSAEEEAQTLAAVGHTNGTGTIEEEPEVKKKAKAPAKKKATRKLARN